MQVINIAINFRLFAKNIMNIDRCSEKYAGVNHGVEGDTVYSGLFGGYFICSDRLNFSERHSIGNYNINNLKYIYKTDENGMKDEGWYKSDDILRKLHFHGERKFNEVK
ncbi:hypothetical protein [Haemophilus influenzae]|uniref:hypothetical protein n=1 Tax=Haemophilus influenzae TaxID=727 RepID=UPI0011B1D81A|nr:hypothetical protein [Haemophilus influenzae]